MAIQEFVEQRIHSLFLDLAERIANGEFGEMTEDEMCGVPLGLFKAESHLIRAWREFLPEETENGKATT